MARLAAPLLEVSPDSPLNERIRLNLLSRIGHDWGVGEQVPSIHQLCRELGTGRSNTWRAVRELVQQGVLSSRHGLGTYVRRLPTDNEKLGRHNRLDDALSRDQDVLPRPSLAHKRVELLMLSPQPEGFVLRMMEHFESAMRAAGCPIIRAMITADEVGTLDRRGADALVLVNPSDHHDIVFGPRQVLVVINTALETSIAMPGRFDVVSVDQEQGGFLAGRRLREIGCKSVCFFGRSGNRRLETMDQTCVARLYGFERGWGERVPSDRIIVAKHYSMIRAAQEVPLWLAMQPRPEGIFAATDELALGLIIGTSAHGQLPGRDFQVVGFDGQQRGRDLADHPLTTVDVPVQEMGRRAAELLLDRLASPDRPVRRLALGCSLFEGATARSVNLTSLE